MSASYIGHGPAKMRALAEFSQRGLARPLVFAHRGGAALRPENTMAAFDHGLSLGADGLELDVHLSRDGVVVVHHDDTLERTTNAHGPLAARTADELARVDAGYRFTPRRDGAAPDYPFRGQRIGIPRFRDVLERHRHARVIIELKTPEAELARRTIDDVRAAGALERVVLGSFHWTGAQRGAPLRAAHSDRRRARGDAVGALPLARALAARPHAVPGVPGPRARGHDGGRHAAVHRARPPRRPAGTDLDRGRSRATCCGCSTGAPTASSATARTSPCPSCASGPRRQTRV